MADENQEFHFSGKEPRINKESHEEFTTIKMNQGEIHKSKENKDT